jgi:hypothetical protein
LELKHWGAHWEVSMTKPPLTLIPPAATGTQPPRELGPRGLELWRSVTDEYRVDDAAGVQMLLQACLALDRLEALAEQISQDGEIIRGRSGPRSHPGLRDEIALRAFVCRTLRSMGLNYEPLRSAPGRPPNVF